MFKFPIILKLTHPTDPLLLKKAHWFSQQPGISIFQKNTSLSHSLSEGKKLPVLHLSRGRTFLEMEGMKLSFHPSMALLRIIQLGREESDRFVSVTGLQQGDTFLDATLGLGTDALVAAYKVGEAGRVLTVEHSAILAALIREGFTTLAHGPLPQVENLDKAKAWLELSKAAKRIEVLWGDHYDVLAHTPSSTIDVIYFDPMFRHTHEQSAAIRPLHHVSNLQPLQKKTILEACRVARKRVVLKERKGSQEFSRLGFTIHEGGKYSNVDYGIIEC
jgi:16S rRNA (guanine1516-N2)-methyltransferase